MLTLEVVDADKLALKSAMHPWLFVGSTVLIVAGLFAMSFPRFDPEMPIWVVQSFGAAAMAIGVCLLLGRTGAVLDRSTGMVTKSWGVLVPRYETVKQVTPRSVRLARSVQRNPEGADSVRYPIVLDSDSGRITLGKGGELMHTWNIAQEVADFLDVDLVDEIDHTPIW
ncbi:MAG: hypothetical protein JSU63_05130 [Phycisphaerales bacterium]|nr:MAG: hypothetical protein JSU63_05130 [Phycisphaerales bacterium]